jgi:hypothetical protein
MTKGYRGIKGVIIERVESKFDFFVIKLESGLQIIAGPSAFEPEDKAAPAGW